MKARLFIGALATFALAAGCQTKTEAPALEAPADLASLVVTDPDFTFETRSLVKLRLEPDAVSALTPVKVYDAEGKLLFKGVVQQPLELGLRLPLGAQPSLTVEAGRGAAKTKTRLTVQDGRAVAKL